MLIIKVFSLSLNFTYSHSTAQNTRSRPRATPRWWAGGPEYQRGFEDGIFYLSKYPLEGERPGVLRKDACVGIQARYSGYSGGIQGFSGVFRGFQGYSGEVFRVFRVFRPLILGFSAGNSGGTSPLGLIGKGS